MATATSPTTPASTPSTPPQAAPAAPATTAAAASTPRNANARRQPRFVNPYRASNPQMTQQITLNSRHSTEVYARSYDSCASAIFIISIVIRARGTDAQATEYGNMADDQLTATLAEIKAEQDRIRNLVEASGMDAITPTYTAPVTVEAPITTPRISRYLQILREFDSAITMIDSAWLQGLINDSDYYKGVYQLKKRIVRLGGRIGEIARRADAAVRQGGNPAALAAVEQVKAEQRAKVLEKEKESHPESLFVQTEKPELVTEEA